MAAVVQLMVPPSVPAATALDLDSDGSLAEMMQEVGATLEADALIVAWHERDADQSVVLFADGVDDTSGAAERALPAPEPWLGANDAEPRSGWLATEDGSGGALTASIPTSAGVVTITGRFNRPGGLTRARAREAVGRLLPMVRPFVRLWAARRAMLSRVRGLTAAVNKSDVGILLVNRHGQLLFANAAAEALLAENDGIRRQGRLLSGGRLADTLKLQSAIEHAIEAGNTGGADPRGPVVALTRKARRPLLAAVIAADAPAGQAQESAAIVYLCDPDQDLTPLVEPACKLYGLSPVETRLACLLSKGMSLTDAAAAMRVREQTARSYLKQIFLKTDTRRQAELVWLMLKSSVRTTSTSLGRLV